MGPWCVGLTRGKPSFRGAPRLRGSDDGQEPGKVGNGSGEIELGGGLVPPYVPGPIAPAGPSHASQPGGGGDTVRKPHCTGACVRPAIGLPLRVQADLPPAARSCGHTAGAELTGRTERRVNVERAPCRTLCGRRGIGSFAGARCRARGTGAGTRRQVGRKILLGEVGQSWSFGHFGRSGAPGVGKLPTGVAIPIRCIGGGCGHGQPGALLALLRQLQRTLGIRRVAGQHRRGRDELRGPFGRGVHGYGRLVAVTTRAAALAPVASLEVMHGHDAIPAHPLF